MCVWLLLWASPSQIDDSLRMTKMTSLRMSLLLFKGGAPNYYPNSFSAPEQQRSALEHSVQCAVDVKRFNSANEDNVTQVMAFWAPPGSLAVFLVRPHYRVPSVSLYSSAGLYRPGWPWLLCALLASLSQVLGLKAHAITSDLLATS